MSRGPLALALALALALPACGSPSAGTLPVTPPTASTAAPEPATRATLADVEATLLGATGWRVDAVIQAEGAVTAHLTASVVALRDNQLRFFASGTFDGKRVDLLWVSDGRRTSAGAATPPHTTEAVAVGLVRMGLLHNVARLVMGATAPDHAEGGVATWVVATDPRPTDDDRLAWGLTVDGQAVASSEALIEPGPHGPVIASRTTRVDFNGVEMTATEHYMFELPLPDHFVIRLGD